MRYDFEFSWESTYGHAARLIDEHAGRGLVVDLGCGAAALSVPMAELGFDYQGFDHDPETIDLCEQRGIRCAPIDLRDADTAVERVVATVGDTPVAAVALLDVIEHLVDPDETFRALEMLAAQLAHDGRPPLFVISIPNVAHFDLGAKLIAGRWDVTEVGLLDRTHVSLFTEARVDESFAAAGFVEAGRADMVVDHTEQVFPVDHPAIARGTPLELFLREVRDAADGNGEVYQFVRCYRYEGRPDRDATNDTDDHVPDAPTAERFCRVIVRTRGHAADLTDVLTCLAAQHDQDFEVDVVVVDGGDPAVERARATVETFAASVRERTAVRRSGSAPVDPITHESARYVALLDDHDLVTADWIGELRAGAERGRGRTVRLQSTTQRCRRLDDGALVAVDGFTEAAAPVFNLLDHLRVNHTPVGSFAVPQATLRAMAIDLASLADPVDEWATIVRIAAWTGVDDRRRVAHVRRVTDDATPPVDATAVTSQLDDAPLLLPPGGAGAIADLIARAAGAEAARRDHAGAVARVEALERSRYWRASAPARSAVAFARRARAAVRHRVGR